MTITRKCIHNILTTLNNPCSMYNCIYVQYTLYQKLYVNNIVICAFVCLLIELNNCQNVDTRFSFNGDDISIYNINICLVYSNIMAFWLDIPTKVRGSVVAQTVVGAYTERYNISLKGQVNTVNIFALTLSVN